MLVLFYFYEIFTCVILYVQVIHLWNMTMITILFSLFDYHVYSYEFEQYVANL